MMSSRQWPLDHCCHNTISSFGSHPQCSHVWEIFDQWFGFNISPSSTPPMIDREETGRQGGSWIDRVTLMDEFGGLGRSLSDLSLSCWGSRRRCGGHQSLDTDKTAFWVTLPSVGLVIALSETSCGLTFPLSSPFVDDGRDGGSGGGHRWLAGAGGWVEAVVGSHGEDCGGPPWAAAGRAVDRLGFRRRRRRWWSRPRPDGHRAGAQPPGGRITRVAGAWIRRPGRGNVWLRRHSRPNPG